jgi:hypothetical protein
MIAQARISLRNSPKAMEAPSPVGSSLLQRKCACGGNPGASGECEECRRKRLAGPGSGIQAKLSVNKPGDRWEQEAERAADAVLAGRTPHSISGFAPGQPLMRVDDSTAVGDVPPSVHDTLASPGRALEASTQKFMEPRFGHDFGRVRVHTDQRAAESAWDINALAYTVGRHIVFGAGQYAPGTPQGRRLLAHELAHVTQQTGGASMVARQTPSQAPPPGQVAAESRAQWYPSFPGCGPWQRRRLDHQLTMARSHVRNAIAALQGELNPSPSGIITMASSALNDQFHTHDPRHIRTIISRMEGIQTNLNRGVNNFRCVTRAGCISQCNSTTADACAGPSAPIRLCPGHFENGNYQGTINLIHEAGHQSGRGLVGGASHIYRHDARFAGLTAAQAMNNPDSYALFVRDLHYGGPLASARPAGSPPEAPHERESRAQREGLVWSPRDLGVTFLLEEPIVQASMGWMDGRRQPVPPADRQVGRRFKGLLFYHPDFVGRERRRPYPAPLVSARVTLIRSSGRPTRSVLLDVTDNNPADAGPGSSLQTSFSNEFDFNFSAADRGTLQVEMRMQDFDTATTIVFQDFFTVRP